MDGSVDHRHHAGVYPLYYQSTGTSRLCPYFSNVGRLGHWHPDCHCCSYPFSCRYGALSRHSEKEAIDNDYAPSATTMRSPCVPPVTVHASTRLGGLLQCSTHPHHSIWCSSCTSQCPQGSQLQDQSCHHTQNIMTPNFQ